MKHKVFLIATIMMALIISQTASAYDFSAVAPTGQTLYYNISGSTVTVTYASNDCWDPYSGYTQPTGALEIPASVTYNGTTYSVTSIGSYAFPLCIGISSVIIPNSVTSIGDYAFHECEGLASVSIPNSVTMIGNSAFSWCRGLTSLTIGNSVTSIGNYAFIACDSLISVPIPNSVTSIGNGAFSGCRRLSSVSIPSSVTSIGNVAFANVRHIEYYGIAMGAPWGAYSMNGVTDGDFVYSNNVRDTLIAYIGNANSVTIPSSVVTIGDHVFDYCSSINSVYIPNSVTSIGDYVFSYCNDLASIEVGNGNGVYDSRGNCNAIIKTTTNELVAGCKNTIIPNTVVSICDHAFYGCRGLTSIIIPNSVSSIGYESFYGCSDLDSVTIGNSVASIGEGAFYYCSSLNTIVIPNSVNLIGNSAFSGCSSLVSLIIGNSVTSIENYAFSGCSSLSIVYFNATSCTHMGGYSAPVFNACNNLNTLAIGENVTIIPDAAFKGCSGLTTLTIPNSVSSIGHWAFLGCSGLTEIISHAMVAPTLGSSVFSNVSSTIPVYIPCGSTASYQSEWAWIFSNYVEPSVPNIDIHTADTTMGTATITTQPTCSDSTAIVIATANYGYHFSQWDDGNTDNPRNIMLSQDTTITAYFAPNQYTLTVTADAHGTASGSGAYYYGDTVTIQAYPDLHYHFIRWNDGNRDNPRPYLIEEDRILTAYFAIDTHAVTVIPNDIERGMVAASGTEFAYGTLCTVMATAHTGYTFAGWSDGENANPYTFVVLDDVELTALFVADGEKVYTVTVESADPTMGSVSGGGLALSGGTVTIRAIPNEGYRFQNWQDGNTDNPRTVTVTSDITYTAYFESTSQGIFNVEENKITVCPNPTSGRIKVAAGDVLRIDVYNINGQLVKSVSGNSVVDITTLSSGIYTMKVATLKTSFVCKVIKK